MKKLSLKIRLFCVAVILLFIWGNSMVPGELSSQESGWVQDLLEPVLRFIGSGRIQTLMSRAADLLPDERLRSFAYRAIGWLDRHVLSRDPTFLVRKAAHLSEYMLLGFFMGLLFVRSNGHGRFLLPELGCAGAALVDEGIQLLSIERAAQLRDVFIDMSGGAMGVIASLIFLALLRLHARARGPDSGKFS